MDDILHMEPNDASGFMDPTAIPVGWVDVDKSYDNILALGMKPFVELSFLPQFVANCTNGPGHPGVRDANGSGVNPQCGAWFEYDAIHGPFRIPADGSNSSHMQAVFTKWGALVKAFATHLVSRYGIDEVASWKFEVCEYKNARSTVCQPSVLILTD